MKRIQLTSDAKADLAEARDWYNYMLKGLGEQFLDTMLSTMRQIEVSPKQFTAGYRGVRKGMHLRFPYIIYYRILRNYIDVFAVLHGRRHSSAWT